MFSYFNISLFYNIVCSVFWQLRRQETCLFSSEALTDRRNLWEKDYRQILKNDLHKKTLEYLRILLIPAEDEP